MLKMKLPLTTLFGVFGCMLYAQTSFITGLVTQEGTKEPISGVIVSLRPEGENRILRFATTNAEGRFEIQLTRFLDNYVVHFSMMSYAPKTLPLVAERLEYNAELSMQATQLREVRFQARSIEQRGDTITYHVENFAEIQDQTLGDVLKRMPGITVEPSGQIRYQDQPINRFYIEGRDMLGSRYGVATNTIHQKDVSSVEVMENHQPIRALQDISFSEDPAINIRLREDAKARWVGTLRAGTGFEPLLWKSELAAMRFKPKTQTLNMYKSNNTGDALAGEIRSFSMGSALDQQRRGYRLHDYIQVAPDNLRQIDDYRSRFNHTHLFSSNNLWSVGGRYDLTSQVSYLNKRLDFDNSTNTTYFLEEGTTITEVAEQNAITWQNRLLGDLTLTANTPTYYFKNKMLADMQWNDMDVHVMGTFPNSQEASVGHQLFSNDLEILKRYGRRAYRLNSINIYQAKPHQLIVTREGEVQRQEIESTAFYSNTYTSLSYYANPVNISMTVGLIGLIRTLESELTGVTDIPGRMENNESMRYLNLYASPSLEYKRSRFDARLNLPLSFVPYRYYDKIADKNEKEARYLLSPRLFMQYRLSSRMSISLSGSYVQSPLQEQSFHEGLILSNYRNLSQGLVDFETGNAKSLSFTLRYRQPLKALFWNAGLTRSWMYAARISNVFFWDPYLLNTFAGQDYHHDTWMMHGNISKGVDAVNGMLSLRSSFTRFHGASFQNSIESPYSSDTWNISPKITSRPVPWINMSYEISFSQNWLRMKNYSMETSYQNLSQKFSGTLNTSKIWHLRVMGEHYYNEITADQAKHFFLADAEFTYRLPKGFEFNVSIRNVFNQDVYGYTFYSGLREVQREYSIRPRNVMAAVFFRF